MRVAWQNQNLRRMEKIEPPPLKMLIRAFLRGNDLKAFLFHQSAFLHFLVYATKSKRLPQPLETQNKSIVLLFFAFLGVILRKKKSGS